MERRTLHAWYGHAISDYGQPRPLRHHQGPGGGRMAVIRGQAAGP